MLAPITNPLQQLTLQPSSPLQVPEPPSWTRLRFNFIILTVYTSSSAPSYYVPSWLFEIWSAVDHSQANRLDSGSAPILFPHYRLNLRALFATLIIIYYLYYSLVTRKRRPDSIFTIIVRGPETPMVLAGFLY
jgi:hypothetical protein